MHSFRKILAALGLFCILPALYVAYSIYLTGKETDDFYKRFTSPPQTSLILGSSRGSSIDPAVLDSVVFKAHKGVRFYNYAFTWGHSPYGPKYLESIKKKTERSGKEGFFILIVEPTALMVDRKYPDQPEYYFENDKSVARTHFVNWNPNLEYLLESFDYSITQALNLKIRPPKNPMAKVTVLDNGKLEVKMIKEYTPEKRKEENRRKMIEFDERIAGLKWSENRVNYLLQTITFLKKHGKVLLVRTPINKVPYAIEEKYVPFFDAKMHEVSRKSGVQYINYNIQPHNYHCTDEVHLNRSSVHIFSQELGKQLLEQ